MKEIKLLFLAITCTLMLSSCGNKANDSEASIDEEQSVMERVEEDTIRASVKEDMPKEEKASTPVSAASRSHESTSNDNMRGFDPASEDDMDDNGMSRYMENDDEEGWE